MKSRVLSLVSATLLLVPASLSAQAEIDFDVTGRAIDSATSEPVVGAEAVLFFAGHSDTTGEDGRFRIQGIRPETGVERVSVQEPSKIGRAHV